ncbi:unnamed protein product [Allacma fusca]|uniref:Nucleoporin p58/p45 n=1 Tax=Allacma fusca TaxID=39272 RepID=A0A8J2KPI4_9HEXA|nr:unnamed protein product [Allacma fusca]
MFSFGSTPTAAPNPGGTAGSNFGFGQTAPPVSAPQTGFSFGSTPAGTAPPSFGAATGAAPNAGLSYGGMTNPAAAPSTGFSFGSTPAPTAQPAATGFSFGQAPAAGLGTAPGVGSLGGVPATGLSFGAPATSAAAGFSFGTTPASTASTGLTFGTPAASTAPTAATATVAPFSFGSKLTATTSAPSTVGSLGGFSFGTPSGSATVTTAAPATGFGFGATSTTTAAPALGTGLFGAAPAVTTSTSAGTAPIFSFGTKLGAPAATTSGLTFGGFGGLGATTTTAAVSTAAAPSSGLGGVPKYATTGAENSFAFGGGSGDGKTENRALQELPLPQEMLLLVEELKNQIKSDKMKFTDLNRSSNDALISKVSEEIEEVRGAVTVVANLIQKHTSNCEAIRALIHEGIANAEMANQTRETPLGSQADHTSPIQYFFRIVDKYRDRMHVYLREIEKAESSLSYVLSAQSSFTSKELLDACNTTRNSIIALAAKIQILHEDVVRMAEAHRNLQRYLLGDATDLNVTSGPKQSLAFAKVLSTKDENRFADVNVLFPHKIVEPPKIGAINMTQTLPTGKPTTPGTALTSTPIRQTHQQRQINANKSSDSLFYPSHALFQTQQSTILSGTQIPSSSPTSHISLKRSKR